MGTRYIGIAGKAGSGKSLTANLIQRDNGAPVRSFASPMKQMLAVLGVSKGHPDFRKYAQTLGTEWGRDCISENIWVDYLAACSKKFSLVIVDDVRFPNEADFIRAHGTLIHMIRDSENIADPDHRSEHALLVDDDVDYTIVNNGSMRNLTYELHKILDMIEGADRRAGRR